MRNPSQDQLNCLIEPHTCNLNFEEFVTQQYLTDTVSAMMKNVPSDKKRCGNHEKSRAEKTKLNKEYEYGTHYTNILSPFSVMFQRG